MPSEASEQRPGFSDLLAELSDSDVVVEVVSDGGARRPPEVAQAQREQINDLQHSFMVAAAHLPTNAGAALAHIAALRSGAVSPSIDRIESRVLDLASDAIHGDIRREDARHFIKQRLTQLF